MINGNFACYAPFFNLGGFAKVFYNGFRVILHVKLSAQF